MSSAERALFEQFASCANNYVEFGSGGSTILALAKVKGSVFSVDSDKTWLSNVAAAAGRDISRLTCHFVDIGPTGEWGYPTDHAVSHQFARYYEASFDCFNPQGVDLFLIDGRFRVQCLLNAALRCRPDAILMMHDYAPRPYYHCVERAVRKIAEAEEMAAFSAAEIDTEAASQILKQIGESAS